MNNRNYTVTPSAAAYQQLLVWKHWPAQEKKACIVCQQDFYLLPRVQLVPYLFILQLNSAGWYLLGSPWSDPSVWHELPSPVKESDGRHGFYLGHWPWERRRLELFSARLLLEKWKETIKQQVARSKVSYWPVDVLPWCLQLLINEAYVAVETMRDLWSCVGRAAPM